MNAAPKTSERIERFKQIMHGVSHGHPQAELAFDIFTYIHMLKTPAQEDPARAMALFDLRAKFAEFAALRGTEELTENPYFADLARIMKRQRLWSTPDDMEKIMAKLADAAAEFEQVSGPVRDVEHYVRRNPNAVRSYRPVVIDLPERAR